MAEQPSCAHLLVEHFRINNTDGTCTDSWRCSDCGSPFVFQRPQLKLYDQVRAPWWVWEVDVAEEGFTCVNAVSREDAQAQYRALFDNSPEVMACEIDAKPVTAEDIDKLRDEIEDLCVEKGRLKRELVSAVKAGAPK